MIKHRYHRVVHASRDYVFDALRDKQVELNERLPNVERCIIVESNGGIPGGCTVVAEVTGKGYIPIFLKPFIRPYQLIWKSHQMWDRENWSCDYFIDSHYFRDNVDISGRWLFEERTPKKTNIYIDSVIMIDAKGAPGVPDQLAAPISSICEQVLHRMTLPNLDRILNLVESMNGNGR